MSFDLKNPDAIYRRAMTTLFQDMIHNELEMYIDDVIIKSRKIFDNLDNLRKFFKRLRRYNLKLNLAKCAFGVPVGKLLRFTVRRNGIELDLSKIMAIQQLPPPKREKDVMSFLGRLNYISRFIAQTIHDETGTKEQAIYYLSKKFTPCEAKYTLIKFTCCALTWIDQKLRHYMSDIKGQALADHLAKNPVDGDYELLTTYFTAEEVLFDGEDIAESYPRFQNEFVDALATLSSMIQHPDKNYMDPIEVEIRDKYSYCFHVDEELDGKPWYHDIKRFLTTRECPENATNGQKKALRRLANNVFLNGEVLY
nr:uncharacterized protein LOC117278410 [Nicotiana tomentosiformis]